LTSSSAYWTSGEGPPLLLVHGTAGVHDRFAPLLPYLEPHATVHVMDRRGRGASGDAPDYDLAREFEDVAAVVDAIAQASGSAVDVYGHSYGGNCAFGAALLTSNIRRLVLYEGWPPVKPELLAFPPEVEERLNALVAAGNREAALETFMREVVMVSEEDIRAIRAQPTWQARVAAAHTITREIRAFSDDTLDPEQAAKITAPVLALTGADTPDELKDDPEAVAAALPDARIVVLEGQQHVADVLVPEVFAGHVLAFLRDQPEGGQQTLALLQTRCKRTRGHGTAQDGPDSTMGRQVPY
jgi:pimeloyl-ACP methyl ester carboxylesterase